MVPQPVEYKCRPCHRQEAEVIELNTYLDAIQSKLYDAHRQLLIIGDTITVETLKNKFLGKEEKSRMLVKIFEDHNKQVAILVGNEFAPATLKRYQTSLSHTVEFLNWKFSVSDIDIRKIDHAFITEFEFYLWIIWTKLPPLKVLKNSIKVEDLRMSYRQMLTPNRISGLLFKEKDPGGGYLFSEHADPSLCFVGLIKHADI